MAGRVVAKSVRREPGRRGVVARGAALQQLEKEPRTDDRAKDLREDVARHVLPRETLRRAEPRRHSGVEMAAGDVPERIGTAQHRQTESKRDTEQSDADVGERG